MKTVHVITILAALVVGRAGYAVTPVEDTPAAAPASPALGAARRGAGKSFLDYAGALSAEEPSYFIPAIFPGPLAPPRREPETGAMLLASFGLMLLIGSRRQRALAASG